MPSPHSNQHQNRGFLSSFHRHRHANKQIDILSHTASATMCSQSPQPQDLTQVGIHSVVSYLESHQELKQQTVLITDHSYPELFFRVSGVKRVTFGESITGENTVKLFEFAHPENLVNFIGDYPHPGIDLFDGSSYIFVRSTPNNWDQSQKVFEYVDEFTSAQLHVGLPTQSTNDASIHAAYYRANWCNRGIEDPTALEPEDCPAWEAEGPINLQAHPSRVLPGETVHGDSGIDKIAISDIYSLRVEDVSSFKDHTFPRLRELTIITKPHEDGSPAVISGIVAPKLRRLAIHYRGGVLPIIENMKVATAVAVLRRPGSLSYAEDPERVATMELLDLDLAEPLHVADVTEVKQKILIDPDFFRNFPIVHLYGTPFALLQNCQFSTTYGLRWKLSQRPRLLSSALSPLKMPILTNIYIEVSASDMDLPGIISTRITSSVYINVTAPCVTIDKAWHIRPICFRHLYVYNSPKLIKAGHIPLISITYAHVSGLMGRLMGPCKTISLTGVFLPFLTRDPSEEHDAEYDDRSEHLDLSFCENATLRPVLSRQRPHPLSEHQGKLFARTGILLMDKVGFDDYTADYLDKQLKRKLKILPLITPDAPSSSASTDPQDRHEVLILPLLLSSDGEYEESPAREVSLSVSNEVTEVFASGQVIGMEALKSSARGSCFVVDIHI